MPTTITGTSLATSTITSTSIDLTTPLAVVDGGTGTTTIKSAIDTLRFTSADQTVPAAGGTLTIAHGLGSIPFNVVFLLKCVTAESGYGIGDLVVVNQSQTSTSSVDSFGFTTLLSSTNIVVKFSSNAIPLILPSYTTGIVVALTNANWRLIVKAEA